MTLGKSTALAFGVLVSKPVEVESFYLRAPPSSAGGNAGQNLARTSFLSTSFLRESSASRTRVRKGTRQLNSSWATPRMTVAESASLQGLPSRHSSPSDALDDFTHVQAITGGVQEFLEATDGSRDGELVTVVTYMPWCRSCKQLRRRLRRLAAAHAAAGSGARFYEMDLNVNQDVQHLMDIHVAPTILLYSMGQLVDEFACGGRDGSAKLIQHVEAQIGSVPPVSNISATPEISAEGVVSDTNMGADAIDDFSIEGTPTSRYQ